ncbi:Two-component system histidine kinase RacS [hydrothermal vent metagenome]|uniref:histidine kinase n=1 Tax=hydrothermal vent metagenome TaxID=652676 RepID=A0A1W1BIB4_9ZZZZ
MNTLRGKINLIFSLAFILLILLFVASFRYQEQRSQEEYIRQERENSHYLYLYFLKYGKIDEEYLESQNIRLIKGKEQSGLIKKFSQDKDGKRHYQVIVYKYRRFILIDNERFKLLLENMNRPSFVVEFSLIFGGALLLLLTLYLWIIRSLKPLSELKDKIKTFSEGNLDIECHSDKSDEIAAVANEFDQAVKMIRELIHSRQLFLRSIMHELKTPIAKGMIVSEMLVDGKQKERLHRIFVRLNLLIDEFAKLEQITSKNFQLHIESYPVDRILREGIDMLMLEDADEIIDIKKDDDFTMQADIELLSLAIKNLLDNAIKYSVDGRATISLDSGAITISNIGRELPQDIESYFRPFHQSENGLGLGLYIVKSILDILHMRFEYQHKDGMNYFTIG